MSTDHLLQTAEEALSSGELEDAVALCDQILAGNPKDADALEIKGLALAELGDFEPADELFERLLKLQPRRVTAHLAAAGVKIRVPGDDRERIEEGLERLEGVEALVRDDQELAIELELLRGVALQQLGEIEAALDSFAQVLDLDPEHPEARLETAMGLFELGRFAEARRGFEELTSEFPDEPWAFHYLGLITERNGGDAERWFSKARELDPEEFPRPVKLTGAEFDRAVEEAVASLPDHAKPHLENTVISVEPLPGEAELNEGLSPIILGVFEGTPIDERLDTNPAHHETARIKLFQRNLERFARTREELLEEIRITVLHEVGHLLGLDEDELYDRGLD